MSFLGLFLDCSKSWLSLEVFLLNALSHTLSQADCFSELPLAQKRGSLPTFWPQIFLSQRVFHTYLLYFCGCVGALQQFYRDFYRKQVSILNRNCCWKSIVMFWMTELYSNVPCHYHIVWDRQSLHHLHMSLLQKLYLTHCYDSYLLFSVLDSRIGNVCI